MMSEPGEEDVHFEDAPASSTLTLPLAEPSPARARRHVRRLDAPASCRNLWTSGAVERGADVEVPSVLRELPMRPPGAAARRSEASPNSPGGPKSGGYRESDPEIRPEDPGVTR